MTTNLMGNAAANEDEKEFTFGHGVAGGYKCGCGGSAKKMAASDGFNRDKFAGMRGLQIAS